jgi:hypothetical protein
MAMPYLVTSQIPIITKTVPEIKYPLILSPKTSQPKIKATIGVIKAIKDSLVTSILFISQ